MPGEANHQLGDQGARRAKRWLEATTRVKSAWLNTDPNMADRLEFDWPCGSTRFSYDIGGMLSGGEFENQIFVAESKKYSAAADQGSHYDSYLAKCYVVRRDHRKFVDQFMWITWHPFRVTTWKDQVSGKNLREAVLGESLNIFGTTDKVEAEKQIDEEVITDVADRLWLLVLSDKQEKLVISNMHRSWIVQRQVESDG